MGHAIGLAVIIVVVGVFMPAVLGALEDFLLMFFDRATLLLETIEPKNAAHLLRVTE
jgi:hypothetical protein